MMNRIVITILFATLCGLQSGKGQQISVSPVSFRLGDYHLKDTLGNEVGLDNYEDKIVVLKFWFTGCYACMVQTETMEPVKSYFRDYPDVVFLNINLDKERAKWSKSLAEGDPKIKRFRPSVNGRYSYEGDINYSTYPQGFDHQLAKALGIQVAPVLVIIGKKGEILDRNPPRPLPNNPHLADSLISLIQRYASFP